MCSKYRSCTINEDTGLGLAFTIAHESGHNSAQATCLADEPKSVREYKYPDKLPGELYDADTQCKSMYGGKFCEGSSRAYKLCNVHNCPVGSIDFRAKQCAEFNSKQFRGWYYNWKPFTQVDGCDRVLGSSAVLDVCGVCKGNNSTCKISKGQYNKQHYTNQYHSVVTIPAGARSIRVYEMNSSSSYLAVRNSNHKYYLNGYWTVAWPGRHTFSGTVFEYKRPYSRPESLTATGPTNETLVIEILLQGRNPGVGWEYALPKPDGDKMMLPKHNYTWAIVRSECSVSCGGGQMTTKAACYRNLRMQVSLSFCNPRSRPMTGLVSCNAQACPPSWSVGDWGECSRSCGMGEQLRQVLCTQKVNYNEMETVTDTKCPQPVPLRRQTCNPHSCPPAWSTGPWSECSVTCGKGIQKRLLTCAEKDVAGKYKELAPKRCHHVQKPAVQLERECNLAACPRLVTHTVTSSARAGWYSSPWSQCTVTCGGGVQARSVQCLAHGRPSSGCLLHQKPVMSQACNTNFCPEPEKKDVPCMDYFNWCYLVPQHGVCNHKFYGKQCCKSCSQSNL
ncbi:UNVERIFIED_CONTAM: hypothetical protein FKN15_047660 [Acipenser sinensis]